MTEHRIRLRGAWDLHFDGDETTEGASTRVDLPVDWPASALFPLRLVRRFGRPPYDPIRETVALEFKGVPGLIAVRLNGTDLPMPEPGFDGFRIELEGTLLPRNALMLRLDAAASSAGPWGEIALVIRRKVGE